MVRYEAKGEGGVTITFEFGPMWVDPHVDGNYNNCWDYWQEIVCFTVRRYPIGER